jgi:glycosyltransferase involved in cell wall biosynthesis
MKSPFVSVVIPTFRRSEYLSKAIDSVLAQTFGNFELIVVEDGSDAASQTIATYGDRVKYLWQPNRGVSAARNFGAAHAKGNWLAFLDDDDIWMPEKLERQVSASEVNPDVGMFHTDHYALVDGEMRTPERTPARGSVPSGWVANDLFLNNFIVMSSVMIRRQEFELFGGFSLTTRYAADLELWLRIAQKCRIQFISEQLTVYRDHAHSLSSELEWQVAYSTMMSRHARANAGLRRDLGDRVVRNHLSGIFWRAAYAHLEAGRYRPAARLFASAWSWLPTDPKPLSYAVACLTGDRGVSLLRAVKRRGR